MEMQTTLSPNRQPVISWHITRTYLPVKQARGDFPCDVGRMLCRLRSVNTSWGHHGILKASEGHRYWAIELHVLSFSCLVSNLSTKIFTPQVPHAAVIYHVISTVCDMVTPATISNCTKIRTILSMSLEVLFILLAFFKKLRIHH